MEKTKVSKKALRSLISESMLDSLNQLQLPQPSKKIKKLIQRNSKKLAVIFAEKLKREEKKKRKAEKFIEDSTKHKGKKNKKSKEITLEGTNA